MGLIDLHRHIDGSLRMETLYALAAQKGISVPAERDIVFHKGMVLHDALSRFAFTLSLLQDTDSLQRVAREICDDAQKNNVSYLELRFAPQLHTGAVMEEVVDAVLDGVSNRAPLILCGLYGEKPDILEQLVDIAIHREGVCGIDLAGGPLASHHYSMRDYQEAFLKAKRHGIGRTVHAGEGRPPKEIAMAILELDAQRIGHGTTLLEDLEVLDLVRTRKVCIEACPTSNVHTSVIDSVEQHPIVRWIEEGVRVSICTDNTLLSQVTAPEEYARVAQIAGMTEEYLERTIAYGREGAFRK